MILQAASTSSTASACASALCRSIRRTRSNYNLTWSTDGVINEYIEPCEAIVDGQLIEVPALEEREEFSSMA